MRKFILVDHSLRDTGGHHYPYAASVLQAAASAGFAPALATHRDFSAAGGFPSQWPLHALFPFVSYSTHTFDTQAAHPDARGLPQRFVAPLRALWRNRQRRRHIEAFAAACDRLFRLLPLADDDVVFLPTASELDLHGLGAYLAATPSLPAVQWHAQLHFGIHRNRDWRGGDADADAVASMRTSLRTSLARCAGQRLRLWCTTEPLVDQYRSLGVADFAVLPYPVHPLFSQFRELRLQPLPVRIACLGHARREKNQRALPALLQSLWSDGFAPGRAQLVVQNVRPALRTALQTCVRQLAATQPPAAGATPLDCTAGKLDQTQYARLVCGSDIGLLLYDARRYHDRCSGVLLEMLVAGVPVVVPARSWLAEQITPANQAWLWECARSLQAAGRMRRLPDPGGRAVNLSGDSSGLLLDAALPVGAGSGCTIHLIQHDAVGNDISLQRLWLEAERGQPNALRLLPLSPGCRAVTLLATVPVTLDAVTGTLPPLGAIGLAIEDAGAAAGALRDILDHIEHYKLRSAGHAVRCANDCSSARIVERLLERA